MNRLTFFILLAFLLTSCGTDDSLQNIRARIAADSKGDILIGCVDTSSSPTLFKDGVYMAVSEINAKGGISGRKIQVLLYDDEGDETKGEKIARTLAGNKEIVAVIGHRYSNVAIPAAVTYEKHGIIFISPGATHPSLTRYGKDFIFRNIPSDDETGRQIADYAGRKGYKDIAVFYQRDFEGKRLSEIFNERALQKGINISARRSFFGWQKDFKAEISIMKKESKFDAIFIAGSLPGSAILVKQSRDMGIGVPIIGGSGLDSPMLITEAGRSAEGMVVSTVFNPKSTEKTTRDFIKKFEEKHGFQPDTWAAQGYDAVSILEYAIETASSSVPIIISSTLKFLENWKGVTGSYSFTTQGDIVGKSIFFKEIKNGKFDFLETEKEGKVDPFVYVDELTLRLPLEGSIATIDPGLSMDITSTEVIEQLFLGLTDFDPNNYNAMPALATTWTVKDNGKVYRFNLRKDAVWTNGDPVTAHDIVWAIQRNIKPETKSPNVSMLYILKNAKHINRGEIKDVSSIGVKAIDDFTVEFTLENPAAYFPSISGIPIFRPLPRKTIEKYGDKWTMPENIVTNGSYKLALWKGNMVFVLRKNPTYYGADKVKIPEVRYFIIPQSSLGLAMYKNNELDIMGSSYLRLPLAEVPNIAKDPVFRGEYRRETQSCTYAFAFNTKLSPVDNVLVRKAIAASIPRGLVIDTITRGGEEVATTYTPWPLFGAVDPGDKVGIAFNPLKANKWLAEAGYPNGQNFPEITLLYNESETHKKIAESIKYSLKNVLNINIKLYETDWDKYSEAIITQGGQHHLFRSGYCSDYPDANNWLNDLFHPQHPMMQTGLTNSEFASVLDHSQMETDLEKRKKLFKRAETILCEEEAAVIPIYFEKAHCLVKSRIKGWYHMAMGGQHIRNWYFEEK
ncbi:MAG: ABC transporter substrate-binding protein [Desulfobacterales bacterium]|nr:ABC transporter substrate-binding protein [Desulfobacterales bacterium]MBF0395448.1 ABC transporter substrate-binding protein [Desulfobacterales bacterium]